MAVPKFDELFNPTLRALHNLGGSASNAELGEEAAKILKMKDQDLAITTKAGGIPQFEYRLAWARSYLKTFGLLENSERGVWSLTTKGKDIQVVDPAEVKRFVRGYKGEVAPEEVSGEPLPPVSSSNVTVGWRDQLLPLLTKMPPDRFERLCQRVLRESGFTQVEVTGRTGDGGIDGVGVVRLGGLLTFPVVFQCKRYQTSVGPSVVRDFRGAMAGRADRGLIMTTASFTRDARKEASRDGVPPIDLVDGEMLLEKLKELRLGVIVRMVEEVSITGEWFTSI
jgi:restriction system protein